jgi:hypothetical protein
MVILAILAILAAVGFAVWVLLRMTTLIRDLMKVTTGLTGLGVEVGRITESSRYQ